MRESKFVYFNELSKLHTQLGGRRIVHVHGVFDVLHAGHLAYLKAARAFGDVLVATLTSDAFVNKGPGRPYFNDRVRAEMLAALEIVDYVSVSDFPTAVPAILLLKPAFYVKGPDYKDPTKDVTGGIVEEEAAVKKGGGQLVFTDQPVYSSSELINRFFLERSPEQEDVVLRVKEAGGLEKIEALLSEMAQLNVVVVGEAIIDTYRFVEPQNISSKSPSISAKFLHEENYGGGSIAIASHLADFCRQVTLLACDSEDEGPELSSFDSRVIFEGYPLSGIPIPRKTRYISIDKSQRIFEVTTLRDDQWRLHSPKLFCDQMRDLTSEADVAILADFGHGLFEDEVLDACKTLKPFTSVNVQSNSSNFGFNVFRKHSRFDYLSFDTREARIAYHDRRSSPLDLGRRARKDLRPSESSVSLTLGPNGAYFFPFGVGHDYFAPAFADKVIDATGAGDAYFAITSMLIKVKAPHIMVPFIGNVFAGLKTKIIGNKSSVTKAQLVKAIASILK